jgi:hypothetical protein
VGVVVSGPPKVKTPTIAGTARSATSERRFTPDSCLACTSSPQRSSTTRETAGRREVLASVRDASEREDWADVNVSDDSLALDALGRLFSAVIFSAAAVEAYANVRRGCSRNHPRLRVERASRIDEAGPST